MASPSEKNEKPSQSKRLRALIFRVWEQAPARSAGMDFETYYQAQMDLIILEVSRQLDVPENSYDNE